MQAHRVEATVEANGSITVDVLPFRPGEWVEVIVLPAVTDRTESNAYPLRGMFYRYERPIDPVAEEDWEVLR